MSGPMDPKRLEALAATIRKSARDQREYSYQNFAIDNVLGCLALLEAHDHHVKRADDAETEASRTLADLAAVTDERNKLRAQLSSAHGDVLRLRGDLASANWKLAAFETGHGP